MLKVNKIIFALCVVGCSQVVGCSMAKPPLRHANAYTLPAPMELGFHDPTWSPDGYDSPDWSAHLESLKEQTKSTWVGIEVTFIQPDKDEPEISPISTVESVKTAIDLAHSKNLKVFLRPILTVGGGFYAGSIHYSDYDTQRQWFQNYWNCWSPFVQLAKDTQVDQLGIATEFAGMQSADSGLWNNLINSEANLFNGPITVDLNWDSIGNIQPWMRNPHISYLGVDAYFPLESKPQPLSYSQILSSWNRRVMPHLTHLSKKTGKPLLFSEVGYGNSTQALWQPYDYSRAGTSTPDLDLQANAYRAVAAVSKNNRCIHGIFFWAWDDPYYSPASTAAQHVWIESGLVHK